MKARRIPWHPLLFSVLPVFFLFEHNKEHLPLSVIFTPLAILVLAAVAIWGIASLVFRNVEKAAILTSFAFLHFFLYSFFYKFAVKVSWSLGRSDAERSDYYIISWAVAALIIFFFVVRSTGRKKFLHTFLTTSALIFLLISVIQIIPFEMNRLLTRSDDHVAVTAASPLPTDHDDASRPDIYYLIFDRYASDRTLQNDLGFNNQPFADFLSDTGFFVSSGSRANYPKTYMSLASSLNMIHLTDLAQKIGPASSDMVPVLRILTNHEVGRFLKSNGYTYLHFGNWWQPTSKSRLADLNFSFKYRYGGSEFTSLLLKGTVFEMVIHHSSKISNRSMKRNWTLKTFHLLEAVVEYQGPKFVFAHCMLPHPPFQFDRYGKKAVISDHDLPRPEYYRKFYVDQLVFTNKMISDLVRSILSKSAKEPVIILQADEGPFIYRELGNYGEGIDWTALDPSVLRSHMEILNAYYFPGHEYPDLYDTITPVNSFRVVFNRYFGTSFELLDDSSYVFSSNYRPYDLIDITKDITD